MNDFEVKDSGARQKLPGGMVRDTTEGKVDYSLVLDGPMFQRWAEHLTKGAQKYEKRNWMKGIGAEVHMRYRESALRHFIEWYYGYTDEDHGAAVFFNINGAEYSKASVRPNPIQEAVVQAFQKANTSVLMEQPPWTGSTHYDQWEGTVDADEVVYDGPVEDLSSYPLPQFKDINEEVLVIGQLSEIADDKREALSSEAQDALSRAMNRTYG